VAKRANRKIEDEAKPKSGGHVYLADRMERSWMGRLVNFLEVVGDLLRSLGKQ
jgi:hypothetical protein